jgi:hypothetical protein
MATTPREWCSALSHPCAFVNGTLIAQPSSSIIGVVLGLAYLIGGVLILRANNRRGTFWAWTPGREDETGFGDRARERCRFLYGITMLIFGVALFFATASYQTFTYQLNCRSLDDPCIDPQTMELSYAVDINPAGIIYLVLQVIGSYCLLLGDTYRALRRYKNAVLAVSTALVALFVLWVATVRQHGYSDLYSASLVFIVPGVLAQLILNAYVRALPRIADARARLRPASHLHTPQRPSTAIRRCATRHASSRAGRCRSRPTSCTRPWSRPSTRSNTIAGRASGSTPTTRCTSC